MPNERRPVIVWIPGGGWVGGSPAFRATDGAELARKGIVVVSLSYRVGVLGFLAHPDLARESSYGATGNYGFLDQLAALRWVQKNISAFGGDSAHVTIFGQSAGAMSVHALMASPLGARLFQRVIATSGSLFPGNDLLPVQIPPARIKGESQADAEQRGVRFAASIGAASIGDMRTRSAEELVKRPAAGRPEHLQSGQAKGRADDDWVECQRR